MKISSLMFVTNAVRRGDTFIEAIKSHLYFSDELILVDGCSTDDTVRRVEHLNDPRIKIVSLPWPEDFCWTEFATHANFGYQFATGDWVATGESDHIFHEDNKVRLVLENNLNDQTPVISVMKKQTSTVDRYFGKARIPYFINKKHFGDKIGYGLDPDKLSDLGKPIFINKKTADYFYEGTLIEPLRTELELYNYLWTFKTFDMIAKERMRANKAWNKCEYLTKYFSEKTSEESVLEEVKTTLLSKFDRGCQFSKPEIYPAIMINKIKKELKPGMFGYDICGLVDYKPSFLD
jgi:glycosyltransferase involved in cell wall biosynthesis